MDQSKALHPAWRAIPATADYQWEGWVAKYQRTIKGYANYITYRPDGRVYGCGGLPSLLKP